MRKEAGRAPSCQSRLCTAHQAHASGTQQAQALSCTLTEGTWGGRMETVPASQQLMEKPTNRTL